MKPARVFVCEAQPIVLEGLKKVLQSVPDLEFSGSADSPELALPSLREQRPDLLLVDQPSGVRALIQLLGDLRRCGLSIPTAVWVVNVGDVERIRLLEAGVMGIVRKQASVHVLIECLRSMRDGYLWVDGAVSIPSERIHFRRADPRLTPRERDIVNLVAKGMTNREIAKELSIAQGTVKVHLMHVFEKTGVRERVELILLSQALGTSSPESSTADPSANALAAANS